jgi:hypothetical protein
VDPGEELQERYDSTLRAELAAPGTRPLPDGFPRPRLPAVLRQSIVAASELADPGQLADFYCERMPRMLVDQILRGDDKGSRLLWMEIDPGRTPRLTAALRGIASSLHAEGLPPLPGLRDLLERRTCAARLAAGTLLGSGLPLVNAYPAHREAFAQELEAGADPQELLDWRLSGNLAHEICHGPRRDRRPAPWLVLEAAAIHLGATAFPRHVVPRIAGEAVPGLALFAVVGEALARLFGRKALWRLCLGESIEDALGDRPGRILTAAGWQEWMLKPEPPFARDASRFVPWVKLADATRGPSPMAPLIDRAASLDPARSARELPDLLQAAEAVPWPELPWWHEDPTGADAHMARAAVAGMFSVDVLEGTFQTHPHRPGRLHLDAEDCLLWRDRDPRGVGAGEPARWIVPPPLCRRLRERGWRRSSIDGPAHEELLDAILELRTWTSSPS